MMKAFAKLTKSKSLPPSDDQIRKHRDQRHQAEQWRHDVEALRSILDDLRTEYERHKSDFAIGRYEELKDMIKSALNRFQETVKRNVEHVHASAPSVGAGDRRGGSVSSLRSNAATFAKRQVDVCNEERKYAEMSSKEADEDVKKLRREVLALKEEFRQHQRTLERLGEEYEASKKLTKLQLNPGQRYKAMKDMIKDTFTPPSSNQS